MSASQEWLQDVRKEYTQDVTFGPILEHLQSSGIRKDIRGTNNNKSHQIRERAKGYLLWDSLLFRKASGEKLCILRVCRPMSFEKHTMLFLEGDMLASKREQWQ